MIAIAKIFHSYLLPRRVFVASDSTLRGHPLRECVRNWVPCRTLLHFRRRS